MPQRITFTPYKPKGILNKAKRADHWFWTRYSAYPYLGCLHGCLFCYCRQTKYSPYEAPEDFSRVIKIKENAADLLRKALNRAPVDMIFTGDYQAVERKYLISRQMLEVCLEKGFPVFVLERSPLVLRDLDLLKALQVRARAVVAFSVIYTPESKNRDTLRQMEGRAAPPEKRFAAMEQIAREGIPVGVCMMPLLPGLCDDDENLEAIVRWTAEHGGQFVLPSSLTLADQQKDFFLGHLQSLRPDLVQRYQGYYPPGSYAPVNYSWLKVARKIRQFTQKHGIADRMPRPIIPGDKHTLNKRIVESLANEIYTMELNDARQSLLWGYRKAAWAVEDLEQDIRLVYQMMGLKGLQALPGVNASLAGVIEGLIQQGSSTG